MKEGRGEERNVQYASAPPKIGTASRPTRRCSQLPRFAREGEVRREEGVMGADVNIQPSFIRLLEPPGTPQVAIVFQISVCALSVGGHLTNILEFMLCDESLRLDRCSLSLRLLQDRTTAPL